MSVGYGFAKMAREQQEDISLFLRTYLEERSNLRLAVLLLDVRRESMDQDLSMFSFLGEEGIPTAVVATKCDKLKPQELVEALERLRKDYRLPAPPVAFSSVTGLGRKEVWRVIRAGIVGEDELDDDEEDGEEDEAFEGEDE